MTRSNRSARAAGSTQRHRQGHNDMDTRPRLVRLYALQMNMRFQFAKAAVRGDAGKAVLLVQRLEPIDSEIFSALYKASES